MADPERLLYFTIAAELGMTVDYLLHHVSSTELSEWSAFFRMRQEEIKRQQEEMENY